MKSIRAILASIGILTIGAIVAIAPSFSDGSASAAPFGQCNSVDNTPGLAISCSVTITNTYNVSTGVGSSVTVLKECHGAANTAPSRCINSSRSGNTVISTVTQCNSAINGGGGNVTCNVRVTNTITGSSTLGTATVNECIGSAGGGGTAPTLVCNPGGSSSGATVTQCNGSANGGGGSMRVRCSVLTSTSAAGLRVTINQCNGSANGGGSTVICTAQITNRVISGGSSTSSGNLGNTGGTNSTPVAGATPLTAAQIAQKLADQRSATAVEESLSTLPGGPISSLSSADTAARTAQQAIREAEAAALARRLAFTGLEVSVYLGAAAVAGLIGVILFIAGRRGNRQARLQKPLNPARS